MTLTRRERDAFFAELPAEEFTPQEAAIRSALLDMLSLRPGFFPLMEWIDKRLGGEIKTSLPDGEIGLQGDAAPDVPADPEAFFATLPTDSFGPEEEALRESIFDFLASWKSQALAHLGDLSKDPGVKACQRSLLPPEVSLSDWVERRIGGEVELRKDSPNVPPTIVLTPVARPIVAAKYNQMVRSTEQGKATPAARAPPAPPSAPGKGGAPKQPQKPVPKEQWLAALPKDQLSAEEAALREAILNWLGDWPKRRGNAGKTMKLSECGQDPEVQRKRQALLPTTVQMREWIDHRIGGEVELRKDDQGWYEIALRGQMPAAQKQAARKEPPAKDAAKAAESFFATLPADELTEQELNLRMAVLDYLDLHSTGSAPPLMSDLSKDRAVTEARGQLLPPEVALRMWMDRRIGGEVEVRKDAKSGAWQAIKRDSGAADAGRPKDTPMSRDEFFGSLPTDSFTEDEEALRDALLTFLENWQESEPPTLSNAGSDAAVRSNRVKVLPKGTPVSLKDWIDRRMGGEIEMQPDPAGQMRFGIRGELNMSGAGKRKASAVDRGGKPAGKGAPAPPAKKGRFDGKGSGPKPPPPRR